MDLTKTIQSTLCDRQNIVRRIEESLNDFKDEYTKSARETNKLLKEIFEDSNSNSLKVIQILSDKADPNENLFIGLVCLNGVLLVFVISVVLYLICKRRVKSPEFHGELLF
jgi:hypothetical protein